MPGYTMHVVSHTHWDREWYLPFQRFRIRLVDLMDHLLEIFERDPEYRYFNLDGQTIILEDYLEIRPEKRVEIEKLVREGKLLIGPWYVLNDEFLVSGEATVRSLLLGHRTGSEFGPVMKVGYLPDQFGNISQMPQILQGFGIDNAIFGRGLQIVGDRKMEFWWESPDGSKVLASLMAFWYNNAQRFPEDPQECKQYVLGIKESMSRVSHVDQLLLMNGVDHLEPQPNLSAILKRANQLLDNDTLVHSTLPNYVDALKRSIRAKNVKLETISGELREDRGGNVLAGTLSSRMYIKQANERCQTALEKYAEPAASIAYMLGGDYPSGLLRYAWKLLLKNHPHDSICGCSIDQVHREMLPRFDQVEQIADEITQRALATIADQVNTETDSLVVFNMLNWPRTDKVQAVIDFEVGPRTRGTPTVDEKLLFESIRLRDDNGNAVPISVIDSGIVAKQVLDPHELPHVVMVKRFVVEFVAENVPAMGYRTYSIEKSDEELRPVHRNDPVTDAASIDNEFFTVDIVSGTLNLRLKSADGTAFPGLNVFEDGGDSGDEYLYVKPCNDVVVRSDSRHSNCKANLVRNDEVSTTVELKTQLEIPAGFDASSNGRTEETVECEIISHATVTRGIPRIDIRTVVENKAKDHRLRALFPTRLNTKYSWAEGQFDVIRRPIELPEDWHNASTFHPMQRWVDVTDRQRGLCVATKGLPEYELYNDPDRTLAVTLLRCVGRLSGGPTAPGAEETPEAQCIGTHTFEYSIIPHEGNWEVAHVWKQAHAFCIPLIAVQTEAHSGNLATSGSFLSTTHDELIVSAVKKAEDSEMLVVRLYNTTDRELQHVGVEVYNAESATLLNLNEEPIEALQVASGRIELSRVGPKRIITLGITVSRK
ncbi:MAG: glycoside hydrolase family 38 C-terminal domain-containing protein [Armatimonadota bacterium]|nr:glycoside hydrolase family 38 C-terminal domain-containing protein [Armatimonadota bacterium]